jgi:hypothetical protein
MPTPNTPNSPEKSRKLLPSDLGVINQRLNSYAIIFVRRMKEGDVDDLKEVSDTRRDLAAQTIVDTLLKFPPEERLEVAFAIEKELRTQWIGSIDDAASRAQFDLTQNGVQNFINNGLGRLQALVQVKLANELTTAVTAAKRIEDSRSGVHMDLVEGAGI